MYVDSHSKNPIKIWASELEDLALRQTRNVANLPFVHHHVALMPDAHFGKGSTIGTVLATRGALVVACVGVDLGCGMAAQPLGIGVDKLGGDKAMRELRHAIERAVPVGFAQHRDPVADAGQWMAGARASADQLGLKHPDKLAAKAGCQLGTLGGGNHFIEICRDESDQAWVMLHSGSRGMGNQLAMAHIDSAKGEMKRYFIELADPDLAYLVEGTDKFTAYLADMNMAQDYALANREVMMRRVLAAIAEKVPDIAPDAAQGVSCHHNYTTRENHFGANVWVTRKGAVRARAGERGILPGSMGTCSYIIEGLGSLDSFQSCAHGAGRAMGRNEARRRFTVKDLVAQTEGVECRKDQGVLDELPAAYKDLNAVVADQKDLARVVHTLKAVLCVKG